MIVGCTVHILLSFLRKAIFIYYVSKSLGFLGPPYHVLALKISKKCPFSNPSPLTNAYVMYEWSLIKTSSKHFLCIWNQLPYARHYNPLLIRNRSWILTIYKARILRKQSIEKTFLDFKKWVKSIQTAGYNGSLTVYFPRHK